MRAKSIGSRGSKSFVQDTRGVSAVEFSLVLPIMLALFFGVTEFGRATEYYRKVTLLGRAVADLTSQGDTQNPVTSATMTDIMASAKLVLTPYTSSGVKIVVSAVGVPLTGGVQTPRVCSSYATSGATARSTGLASDITVPEGFQLPGARYILAEVSAPYSPLFGSGIMRLVGGANNQFTFKAKVPWPVRGGQTYYTGTNNEIVLPSGSPCPANL
jgi:Flp pilus assembly protein TadG